MIFDIIGTLLQVFAMKNRDLKVNLINLTLISENVMLVIILIPIKFLNLTIKIEFDIYLSIIFCLILKEDHRPHMVFYYNIFWHV